MNLGDNVTTYGLTAIFWARWQPQTHFARLPNRSLDPKYVRAMSAHWVRAALSTQNGLAVFWVVIEHMSSESRRLL